MSASDWQAPGSWEWREILHSGDGPPDDPVQVKVFAKRYMEADEVAEAALEHLYHNSGGEVDAAIVEVRDPAGVVTRWSCEVEHVAAFNAYPRSGPPVAPARPA